MLAFNVIFNAFRPSGFVSCVSRLRNVMEKAVPEDVDLGIFVALGKKQDSKDKDREAKTTQCWEGFAKHTFKCFYFNQIEISLSCLCPCAHIHTQ